jgi:hypothetical protein
LAQEALYAVGDGVRKRMSSYVIERSAGTGALPAYLKSYPKRQSLPVTRDRCRPAQIGTR